VCDQFYVEYHGDRICPGTYCDSVAFQRTLACHETGHTVGLLHGSNANPATTDTDTSFNCMRTNPMPANDTVMGTHNVGEVDDEY